MRPQGFTLVEMSVVLVIAGLVLAAVMTAGTAQIAQTRIITTKSKEEAVRTALITFIARNNRLPCPAVPTLEPDDDGYGVAADSPGCTNVPSYGAGADIVYTGVLPWSSLGLSSESASDGYYNRFTYMVSGTATETNSITVSGLAGNITIHTDTPALPGSPAAGNQSNECANGLTVNPCAAAAAIISHGANGNGAYTTEGKRIDLPGGNAESENTDGDTALVIKDFVTDSNEPYDDIVLAMPASELLAPLTFNGSIKDYNAKLQDDFRKILGVVVTDARVKRTGSIPEDRSYPLPFDINSLGLQPESSIDPWGTPYEYDRVTASIEAGTTNVGAYTVTSYGPDKAGGGGDDIVLTVTVSELKSYFLNYGW